jgi:hypothetical protein
MLPSWLQPAPLWDDERISIARNVIGDIANNVLVAYAARPPCPLSVQLPVRYHMGGTDVRW